MFLSSFRVMSTTESFCIGSLYDQVDKSVLDHDGLDNPLAVQVSPHIFFGKTESFELMFRRVNPNADLGPDFPIHLKDDLDHRLQKFLCVVRRPWFIHQARGMAQFL